MFDPCWVYNGSGTLFVLKLVLKIVTEGDHQVHVDPINQTSISQRDNEPMIKILILIEKWWRNQVKILHMSRQLGCRDMCKILTWLDDENLD